MKSSTVLFLLLFLTLHLQGQIGLNARYTLNDASAWTVPGIDDPSSAELIEEGYSFGLDYRILFKDIRVELVPELNFSKSSRSISSLNTEVDTDLYGILLGARIYPFDLEGDCTCPTWHQDGSIFKKGFYLQVTPGIHFFDGRIIRPDAELTENSITASIGAGIGLDLGLSDRVTITPHANLRYLSVNWEGLSNFFDNGNTAAISDETDLWQLEAGIRLGIHFGR